MQFPAEVRVRPSRGLMASVVVVHVAAALALFNVPAIAGLAHPAETSALARAGAVLAWLLVFASLARALLAERSKHGMVLWLEDDGLVEIQTRDLEEGVVCRVDPDSVVVLPWAAWFRPLASESPSAAPHRGVRRLPRMMLTGRNMPERQWHLLCIWLRHKASRCAADSRVSS